MKLVLDTSITAQPVTGVFPTRALFAVGDCCTYTERRSPPSSDESSMGCKVDAEGP